MRRGSRNRMHRRGSIGFDTGGPFLCAAGHYQSEETLYEYTVAKNPGSWSAWSNLGLALGEQGRFDEAINDLKRAIEIEPGNARVQYNYAKLVIDRGERNGFRPGDVAEALPHFREAVRLQPGWSPPEIGIGVALLRDNRTDEAQIHLERGLALEPDNVEVLCALAVVLSERGNLIQRSSTLIMPWRLLPSASISTTALGSC